MRSMRFRACVMAFVSATLMLCVSSQAQQDSDQPPRIRVSEAVLKAFLVHKVLPEYPADALKRGVDGTVTVNVFIDVRGDVEKVSDADGDPLLVPAVIDAVKQWKFKPYYLNRKPVPIESQVTITFELKGNKWTVRY